MDHRGRWRLRPIDHGRRTHLELRVAYHAAGGVMALLADVLAFPVAGLEYARHCSLPAQINTTITRRNLGALRDISSSPTPS